MLPNRIALGTVQFGMLYGIANSSGQVSPEEVQKILKAATKSGITMLDTAIAYGDSEKILGEAGVEGFRLISKLPAIPANETDVSSWVQQQIGNSLARLKVSKIDGLLLHKPSDLTSEHGVALANELQMLKRDNVVEKLGISIYNVGEISPALTKLDVEIIQTPFNLLDRQILDSGWMDQLSAKGIEIHVRSVFLQGLLLLPVQELLQKFPNWKHLWLAWDQWLKSNGVLPVQACLGFVKSFSKIDKIVVGVDSLSQLKELLECQDCRNADEYPDLDCTDGSLINPALWKFN